MEKVHKLYRHEDVVINDAFDRIFISLQIMNDRKGYQMIVLSGSEPKSGTTTLSINLAISSALSGKRVLLIDGDIRKDNMDKILSDDAEFGLSDFLMKDYDITRVVNKTNYSKLDYVACGSFVENVVGCLCADKMDDLMVYARANYDCIYWDMPALSAAVDAQIIATQCDGVIIVAAQNGSKEMLTSANHSLKKVDANVIGVLGNMVDRAEYRSFNRDYNYFSSKKYKVHFNKKEPKVTDVEK